MHFSESGKFERFSRKGRSWVVQAKLASGQAQESSAFSEFDDAYFLYQTYLDRKPRYAQLIRVDTFDGRHVDRIALAYFADADAFHEVP